MLVRTLISQKQLIENVYPWQGRKSRNVFEKEICFLRKILAMLAVEMIEEDKLAFK